MNRIRPVATIGFILLAIGFGYNIVRLEESQQSAANSRSVTVKQRCELTEIILDEAQSQKNVTKLETSLAGCKKQLVKVEAEASH